MSTLIFKLTRHRSKYLNVICGRSSLSNYSGLHQRLQRWRRRHHRRRHRRVRIIVTAEQLMQVVVQQIVDVIRHFLIVGGEERLAARRSLRASAVVIAFRFFGCREWAQAWLGFGQEEVVGSESGWWRVMQILKQLRSYCQNRSLATLHNETRRSQEAVLM